MNYQRTKAGTLYVEVPIGDEGAPFATLRFSAHTIRRERTGVHANVGIWFDSNQLEYDTFNIERNEERRRLAKGSWNLLPNDERGVRNWIPLENLKADLDLFCEGLWAAHVGRVEVEPMRAETFHPRRMLGPYLVEEGGTILYGNPGGGKALALDTPIPTPSGWTTMGAIKVGDQVFDEMGQPCNVVATSPVWKNRPVYNVRLDSGESIVADAEHEWLVDEATGGLERSRPYICDTTHLSVPREKRLRIQRTQGLVLPDAALPVDPYVLGLWLGDGIGREAAITQGAEDMAFIRMEIERLGHQTTLWGDGKTFGVRGLQCHLWDLNLVSNKHIPGIYLRASREQRLALLQGLVDTDGHVAPTGRVEFTSTTRLLAEGVRDLVAGLGRKVSLLTKRATLYGKDCGPRYTVNFYMKDAARLPRKAALCRDAWRTIHHYIDATPAGTADTRCIQVDSPSHLFLAGYSMIPTHNSWIAYLLAQSMNSGSPVVWPSVKKGHRPLLVNLERSRKDVESRLWTINRTLGINGTEHPLDTINGRGMSLRDVEGAALRHIEKHGNDILFLDSISRIGGGSMNKDDVANEAMDMLNRLCPTWFAIAHQAKGGTDPVSGEKREASTFGSVMYAAACDMEVGLTSDATPSRIVVDLYVRKKNVAVVSSHETLYLDMDTKGLMEVLRPDEWDKYRKTG